MKQSLSSHAALVLVLGCSLLTAGCSKEPIVTDTGNPYDDTDGNETGSDGCDAVETEIELGASTALGFNAQAIADLVAGEQQQTLRWLEVPGIEYGPESGQTGLTLRVEPLGTARFVDRSPRERTDGAEIGLAEPLDGCRDSLALDARLVLGSDGGALAESIETRVEAYAADFAVAAFTRDVGGLAGSFDAQPTLPPNMQLTRVQVVGQIGFSEYGAVGNLGVQSEMRSSDGSAVGQSASREIAHFPADDYCGAPNGVSVLADQAVRGLSLQAALDGLNAQSPSSVQFTPGGSSQLELTFATDAERVCITFDRDPQFLGEVGGATLHADGTLRVLSEDGRLDGEFGVQLSAQTVDGGLEFRAEAGDQSQDLARAAQLPASFGVRDTIRLDGYEGGSVRFQSVSTTGASGGTLVVGGLDVPECISNPPPVDPDAMGSPGCRGIDAVPLWSARWGNLQ